MNDLITSSTQSTSPAANLDSNHQSLFKLPFIFIILMIFISLFIRIFWLGFSTISDLDLYLLSAGMANQIFNSSLLYFMIATIVFAAQRMHQITTTNLIIVVMSCIIIQLFNYFFTIMIREIYRILVNEYSYFLVSQLQWLLDLVFQTLKILILIAIITLVSQFGKTKRTRYYLLLGNNRTVFAALFSFIFLLPSVAIFLPSLQLIFIRHMLPFVDEQNMSNVIVCLLGVLASLLFIIVTVVNFLIVFFSVKNCFVRETDTIPLKSLFKAVGWSYLYLLGFGIGISIVYISIVALLSFSMPHYDQRELLTFLLVVLSLIIFCINLIGVIKLLRKAVRKYFS